MNYSYNSLIQFIDSVGGDTHILGFMFGSGYKFLFKNDERFNRNIHLDAQFENVIMHATDSRDKPFSVYGLISDITHIYVATDPSKGSIDTSVLLR